MLPRPPEDEECESLLAAYRNRGTDSFRSDESEVLFWALRRIDPTLTDRLQREGEPCRHDSLVRDFAAATRGVLDVRHIRQDPGDDEDWLRVQFAAGRRLYRFSVWSDWSRYDVWRTWRAMNFALADQGLGQRFMWWRWPEYPAPMLFLFGDEVAIMEWAARWALPFERGFDRNGREVRDRLELEAYAEARRRL